HWPAAKRLASAAPSPEFYWLSPCVQSVRKPSLTDVLQKAVQLLDAGRLTGDGRGLNGRRWMIFGFAHLPSSTASVEPISPRLRIYPQVTRNGHIRFALGAWATAFYEQIQDRKSTRLNSSHVKISYAVFCLKKKRKKRGTTT